MTSPVETWVAHVAEHTTPASVHWLSGAAGERDALSQEIQSERGRPPKPLTIMCAGRREDVSPTAEFLPRAEATARFWPAFRGSMRGRAMYVLPYVLGRGTANASAGVQITDDPKLVAALARRLPIDPTVREAARFVRSVHALQAACAPVICCFTDARTIWSPSVGWQDFLDARTHALRLTTFEMVADECLAARMAVVAVPGERAESSLHYAVVAPADLASTPLSLLGSTRERGHYRALAGEVAWLTVEEGRLHAVLCENAPPTEDRSGAPAMVPLDAIIFCTRRASTVPLVLELPTWARACHAASMLVADADDGAAVDPMGMAGFCGVDLNAYIDRWLALGPRMRRPPKTFQLNWFLRGPDGSLLWPALLEGWRVIEWMTGRVDGQRVAHSTCAGFVPAADAIDRAGLRITDASWRSMFDVAPESWARELESQARVLARLGSGAPLELHREHHLLVSRLADTLGSAVRAREITP